MFGIGKSGGAAKAEIRGEIRVSDPEVRERLRFLGLTEQDLEEISRWRSVCEGVLNPLVDEFYAKIFGTSTTRVILEKHSSVERQRPMLSRYILTLFSGRVDDTYVEYRRRVGAVHDGIDLDSNWYIGMYDVLRRVLGEAVAKGGAGKRDLARFRAALDRLIEVDMALVITALTDSRRTRVERLSEEVREQRDQALAFLGETKEVLGRVADRDLTARVTGSHPGEFASIQQALNTAVHNLAGALDQIQSSVVQVAAASGQISAGSESLAQGASEQAASLQEVGSSLHELSSAARDNAAHAQSANRLAEEASGRTDEGVASMRQLSRAVERIKGSADQTAKIVKTIDEIAFQTNLLALNAAVEAARAGEAGKGFAVVAEEVRNLAMRSAEAARSTAELIEGSVRSADEGVALNGEVLRNLEEIHAKISQVREVVAHITTSSQQQSQGVGQINGAVEQMNALTQQVAASAEESAAAAEELSGQAGVMQSLVDEFTLADRRGWRAPSPPQARGAALAGA